VLPAFALCLGLAAFDGELAAWLERAGASDWAERERAQRWLATHLETADAGAVALRAASGDAEVRARLARAIGGQARLLELASRLALRTEPPAVELGREALREQILGFDPGAEAAPSEAADWLSELRRGLPELLGLSAELRAGPAQNVLDLLARHASGAPPLVLDPRALPARSPVEGTELAGTLPELLLQCASDRGLYVRGFGFDPATEGRPWILLAPLDPRGASAAELLAAWVTGAADPAREADARASDARALAAVGWPAALEFLERRWVGGDEAALDGLLLAAGRGRVVPALQDPQRQRTLYARLAGLVRDERDRAVLLANHHVPREAHAVLIPSRLKVVARMIGELLEGARLRVYRPNVVIIFVPEPDGETSLVGRESE